MGEIEPLHPPAAAHDRLQRHAFDRLIMLSDGVFAIAITLAAIEIHPPHGWRTLDDLMAGLKFPLAAFALSFAVISAYWLSHRDLYARLARVDNVLTLTTLLGLFAVALVPAATQLIYTVGTTAPALQAYAAVLFGCGVVFDLLWAYGAFRPGLMLPDVTMSYRVARVFSAMVAPLVFGWLMLFGARGFGGDSLYVAIFATAVLMVVRRFVLPRLAGERPRRR